MPDQNIQPNIPLATNTPNVQEIIRRGQEIYNSKKNELEPSYNGQHVVIEIESGRYFIGDTRDEAIIKAKREFPHKVMFVKRVGGIEKVSRHVSKPSYFNYARVL